MKKRIAKKVLKAFRGPRDSLTGETRQCRGIIRHRLSTWDRARQLLGFPAVRERTWHHRFAATRKRTPAVQRWLLGLSTTWSPKRLRAQPVVEMYRSGRIFIPREEQRS